MSIQTRQVGVLHVWDGSTLTGIVVWAPSGTVKLCVSTEEMCRFLAAELAGINSDFALEFLQSLQYERALGRDIPMTNGLSGKILVISRADYEDEFLGFDDGGCLVSRGNDIDEVEREIQKVPGHSA